MKAYKIWYDEKNFIHKDTTNEMNLKWTTEENEAKEVSSFREAVEFFFDTLGFDLNLSRPNALHLLKNENT